MLLALIWVFLVQASWTKLPLSVSSFSKCGTNLANGTQLKTLHDFLPHFSSSCHDICKMPVPFDHVLIYLFVCLASRKTLWGLHNSQTKMHKWWFQCITGRKQQKEKSLDFLITFKCARAQEMCFWFFLRPRNKYTFSS